MAIEFTDNSAIVKAAIDDAIIAFLYEAGGELEAQAKRNQDKRSDTGQTMNAWTHTVDESKGECVVGNPLQNAIWEEFGTGEHAVKSPHRTGWWLYFEGGSGYEGETNHYATREEAEKMAAFIKKKYGKTPKITDGRDPSYTLQNAFMASAPKAEADLERKLKERFGK